eukprot:4501017-Ditylum_brightwellii.AAC.1
MSEHGQDKEPSDPLSDGSGEIHIQHNPETDLGELATSEMFPGMDTNPGELSVFECHNLDKKFSKEDGC